MSANHVCGSVSRDGCGVCRKARFMPAVCVCGHVCGRGSADKARKLATGRSSRDVSISYITTPVSMFTLWTGLGGWSVSISANSGISVSLAEVELKY